MELKPVDLKILRLLCSNGRFSYREIGRKLSLSVATVMHHVQAMEQEGIIKGYAAVVNHEKLGFDVQIICDVRVSKGKLHMVEKRIAQHPNVFAVYDNTGDFDATIIAKFRNRRAMDKFLKEIQTYDFVERTVTKLILSTMTEKQIEI